MRTLRAAVAKALGVEEAAVKRVVRETLMAHIADKPPEEDEQSVAASAPAPARKSRFDVPAPAAIAVAAQEPDFGARLAARAERFGAKAPTDHRDRSRRRRSRSRSRERSRRRDQPRDEKRRKLDIYVPPPRRR